MLQSSKDRAKPLAIVIIEESLFRRPYPAVRLGRPQASG
jgi:hypothetical protein